MGLLGSIITLDEQYDAELNMMLTTIDFLKFIFYFARYVIAQIGRIIGLHAIGKYLHNILYKIEEVMHESLFWMQQANHNTFTFLMIFYLAIIICCAVSYLITVVLQYNSVISG